MCLLHCAMFPAKFRQGKKSAVVLYPRSTLTKSMSDTFFKTPGSCVKLWKRGVQHEPSLSCHQSSSLVLTDWKKKDFGRDITIFCKFWRSQLDLWGNLSNTPWCVSSLGLRWALWTRASSEIVVRAHPQETLPSHWRLFFSYLKNAKKIVLSFVSFYFYQ